MSVLVVGGAGYIGSHFVHNANDSGKEIIVVDNLSTGHRKAVPSNVKFYQADIRDKEAMDKIFKENKDIDAVVHFAADSQVPESVKNPLKYFNNNTGGMISLLETMNENDVKKIIFSSTAATYGIPKTNPILETDETNPINPYGLTKLQMEQIINWVSRVNGFKYVALRYFNVAGAKADGSIGEDHNPESHLVPNILFAAKGLKDKITMFGNDYDTKDGFNVRDYVHVSDLADAHLLALEYLNDGNDSNTFNLGSKNGFSVKEMLLAAQEATGMDIPSEVGPRRQGDPDVLIADSTKAKEVLKWNPKYDNVVDIISSAWNWMEKNPKGYNDR